MEVAQQAHPAGSILRDKKQSGFTFPMIITTLMCTSRIPCKPRNHLTSWHHIVCRSTSPGSTLILLDWERRPMAGITGLRRPQRTTGEIVQMILRSAGGNTQGQMRLYEYRQVPDQVMDYANSLQVQKFKVVKDLPPAIDWAQDPITDFEAVMEGPRR